jgi:N,N'-diacetyllegionaminate synthase
MTTDNHSPYLIAETAFHHQGDKDFLKELIAQIRELEVQAIKFHLLLDLGDYMVAHHTAFDALQQWCLGEDDWLEILKPVSESELDLILLCNDRKSIDFCLETELKVHAIELHATGINDHFLLEKAAQFPNWVILGTGGATLDELHYAIRFLRDRGKEKIFLMHGFQNYPTDYQDIELSRMQMLQALFDLPVGYADHTDPADPQNAVISCLAAAMGFPVLEKHFTHRFGEKRIDAQAAVSREQMLQIKSLMQTFLQVYGQKKYLLSEAEKKYGNTGPMKKAIVAARDIPAGQSLSEENLAFKRTETPTYLQQRQFSSLLGAQAQIDIKKDELVDFSKISYEFKPVSFEQFDNK